MRNDEIYKLKPQSNQLEIQGLGSKGEALMNSARKWVEDNPVSWRLMVAKAHQLKKRRGYISMNYIVNYIRNEYSVSIKNTYAPALARILIEQHPEFSGACKTRASITDGFSFNETD